MSTRLVTDLAGVDVMNRRRVLGLSRLPSGPRDPCVWGVVLPEEWAGIRIGRERNLAYTSCPNGVSTYFLEESLATIFSRVSR
jgi:hypothetical protein